MRKLIAGMKVSIDGKIAGPDGNDADWVESWSEDYELTPRIDACVVGGGMYPDYEQYWNAIYEQPGEPVQLRDRIPSKAELEWARFAQQTPHYVLSNTVTSALWPKTRFLHGIEDVSTLKQQPGKDIYLMGGAETVASLIDARLVDELRLIIHPLIAGEGKALFATTTRRSPFELRKVQQLPNGRVSLIYGIGS